MGYYMRYVVADERPVALDDLAGALTRSAPGYEIDAEDNEAGIFYHRDAIGHLTLNFPGDGLFDDEQAELIEVAESGEGPGKQQVLDTLREATCIVCVQVLHGNGNDEETLAALDPIWEWLHANRRGLLHAEGEGYFGRGGLVLRV